MKSKENNITLFINGESYDVDPSKFTPEYKLVDFIRTEARLTGTKWMCREGGCGACVVSRKSKDSVTGQDTVTAINSCLTPLLSCDGWNISTVESLGNRKEGLHPIQKRLVEFSGSQCGFCTSGMVMSMHSLMESKKGVTSSDVDKILDGNICRCTGYRPILDAFKSLSVDASEEIRKRCTDIEDCATCPCTFSCRAKCSKAPKDSKVEFPSGEEWLTPSTLPGVLEALQGFQKTQKKYRLVAGNTGSGVFKEDGPYGAYVDLGNIDELRKWSVDPTGVTLGAGITLSETIEILKKASETPGLGFGARVAEHMGRIANLPVRNRGTLAGNLMLKHAHKDFPSDIFLLMETLATKIRIASPDDSPKMYTLVEFLNLDMYGKVILSLLIPQRKNGYHFRSFKITRRYQNAHAYVNGGFLFKLSPSGGAITITEKPRICFGGINNSFVHASATEAYLLDKNLRDVNVLRGALETLDKEIRPEFRELEGSVEYRKFLAKSLLYKTILEILGDRVDNLYLSGAQSLMRAISTGKPEFETDKTAKTVYAPVLKLEGPVQTTGEAEYINDIPSISGEVFAAYVLSSVGNATLDNIDASDALKMAGVVSFISAKDIPNQAANNSMPHGVIPVNTPEPIFASKQISYAGQALGLILAESKEIAFAAVKKVRVTYSDIKPPVVDIKEAYKNAEAAGILDKMIIAPFKSVDGGNAEVIKVKHEIKGEFLIGGQAHFHMETQGCIAIPKEDGLDITCGTQWIDHAVVTISQALGIPTNSINIKCRRLGGSFGARITKATSLIAATAVAAYVSNRPVRVVLDMETNMAMIGKRLPYLTRYDVGFDDLGRIGRLNIEAYSDTGYAPNEPDSCLLPGFIQNVYKAQNWEVKPGFLITNTASNTWARGPGMAQGVAIIEYLMEHIAHTLRKDPLEVRMNNLASNEDHVFPTGDSLVGEDHMAKRIIDETLKTGDYFIRKLTVESFNNTNRWKKRGISMVPVRFHADFFGSKLPTFVTINHFDGTVQVSHGGIEMGNGINTKVAQVVASELQIPVDLVSVKATNSFTGNNATFTGGSITSELCCDGAMKACRILNERLNSVKGKMDNKEPSWVELVTATWAANMDLSACYMHGPNEGVKDYFVWLGNITEVEIDVLTGEFKVVRVDLVEDTGKSLNPAVDLGQIEGAYVMGQGLWTTEKLGYDSKSGKLLTDRTWTYKVPESKDIPEDFRVKLFSSVPNPKGVLGSKATGEPPLCSSVCVIFALKNAIDAARKDGGNTDWYQLDGPVTPEDVAKLCLTSDQHFQI